MTMSVSDKLPRAAPVGVGSMWRSASSLHFRARLIRSLNILFPSISFPCNEEDCFPLSSLWWIISLTRKIENGNWIFIHNNEKKKLEFWAAVGKMRMQKQQRENRWMGKSSANLCPKCLHSNTIARSSSLLSAMITFLHNIHNEAHQSRIIALRCAHNYAVVIIASSSFNYSDFSTSLLWELRFRHKDRLLCPQPHRRGTSVP